jgi:hypothetical protein
LWLELHVVFTLKVLGWFCSFWHVKMSCGDSSFDAQ